VLKADNNGEGGVLALMTLLLKSKQNISNFKSIIILFLGLFGAALLYGDGLITPVISVLSAVEGISSVSPSYDIFIIPSALIILLTLFAFQKHGSGKIGLVFGPIMFIWFFVIGLLGFISILKNPSIFMALDPRYSVYFFLENKMHGFFILGTIFLVLTGGEALYQDIGHFGKKPVRTGWFFIVFPALILNYFGQGAYLLNNPEHADNLFYRLSPSWATIPMVILATVATVIASQAVISGVFSLAKQTVQLGYFPRLSIFHTSSTHIGQVYVPFFNGVLVFGAVILILAFGKSEKLAGAYGVAVSLTMLITTVLLFFAMRQIWKWNFFAAFLPTIIFLSMNVAFLCATLMKIKDGGWISLFIATAIIITNYIWENGRINLRRTIFSAAISMEDFLKEIEKIKPIRVPGIAVFLAGSLAGVPRTLLHNYKHNKILHEKIVILTVLTEEIPIVKEENRMELKDYGLGFYWISLRYGFTETPNILMALSKAKLLGLVFDPMQTTYFLGRETLIVKRKKGRLPNWAKTFFAFLSKNACDASKFFNIPANRVIEIGIQIEM
jgi:KUP system potassium uptake protein